MEAFHVLRKLSLQAGWRELCVWSLTAHAEMLRVCDSSLQRVCGLSRWSRRCELSEVCIGGRAFHLVPMQLT